MHNNNLFLLENALCSVVFIAFHIYYHILFSQPCEIGKFSLREFTIHMSQKLLTAFQINYSSCILIEILTVTSDCNKVYDSFWYITFLDGKERLKIAAFCCLIQQIFY